MGIDPSILSDAGRVAYDDSLTTDERRERLDELLKQGRADEGDVAGYFEMLSMLDGTKVEPVFLTWAPQDDIRQLVQDCGALQEVDEALRRAYARTEGERRRLCPSSVVERELRKSGWHKTRVWAPEGRQVNETMDGWKEFPEAKVGVEVEWQWQKVMPEVLKFWRAQRGEQIDAGIEVVRGRRMFEYVTCHVWRLYEKLFRELPVVFCALEAPDLNDQKFPAV